MTSIQLGYWNVRGTTHPIRQLVHLTKLECEYVSWATREEWLAKREEIFKEGDPFPNCPYIIHGDFKLTETGALPFYICKIADRQDLIGKTLQDEARVNQIKGVITDLHLATSGAIYDQDKEAKIKEAIKEGGKTHIFAQRLSDFLGEQDFLLGYLTFVDLLLVHFLQFGRNLCLSLDLGDPFAKYKNLIALCKRIENLPELQDFEHNYPYVPAQMFPWYKEHPLPE